MQLSKLYIRKDHFHAGQFVGEIEVEGDKGKVALVIDHEQSLRLIAVVADALVATARTVAEGLTVELIASQATPVKQLTGA